MIRFTIVTITYNAEKVLQRTLDSVRYQTYEGVEHLIVDGASKDQTLAMAEQYKQQSDASDNGHKVIIQSEPDHGIYDAMNKGLTQASGDYVVFMNAGDFFPSTDTLEKIVHQCRLSEYPAAERPGVLYGNTNIVPASTSLTTTRQADLEIVPSWYVGMPSGFLCQNRYCQKHTVRHTLPFFSRCRLVYPNHARNRTHGIDTL